MRLCNWGQARPWGLSLLGKGLRQYNKGLERDLGGRAGGEVGETVSLQASPSARPEPTAPRHSPPLPPSLAPSLSPENGMLKTGCVWNLFRKESPIHHSWAISQEAFSKHTGFRKSVFRPPLVTFLFSYPSCFNFLHKLFYFRIVFDLQRERREFPQTPHPALPDADASHSSATCVVTKEPVSKRHH